MINNDTNFNQEFDLIGWSQGTTISRYIIQQCELVGKVRKFVSFGGPLNGESLNKCSWVDFSCIYSTWYRRVFWYTDYIQNSWAPANLYKDPEVYDRYLAHSLFIARLNNEVDFSQKLKEKFMQVEKYLFIRWADDSVIIPRETSWWGEFDRKYNIITRFDTRLYKEDLIGLKTLEEQNRTQFIYFPGDHMYYTFELVDTHVIPFLTDV